MRSNVSIIIFVNIDIILKAQNMKIYRSNKIIFFGFIFIYFICELNKKVMRNLEKKSLVGEI